MEKKLAVIIAVVGTAIPALAGPFGAGNLVVMRVSSANPGGSGAIILEEFTRLGAPVSNSIALPASGPDAVCVPDLSNHDRHLHLSSDGKVLALVAYGMAPGATDPSGLGAGTVPRVVGLVRHDGTVDVSTRLTNSFDFTSIRGAFTTDGSAIWVSGDNASAATLTGGLRYATRGSSTSVNLSQVQALGGGHGPDNVRDAAIFGGQLYDCSGSSATIGKGVFQVGTGLPASGSQMLSVALNGNDGASASSFFLLDLDPGVPGVDVLYTAASATGEGVHKYVKTSGGAWESRGFYGFAGVDHVIASSASGSVTVFAASINGVISFVDTTPLTGMLTGSAGGFLIECPAGFTLGGIDFAPSSGATVCYANCDGSTIAPVLNVNDFTCFLNAYAAGDSYANCDGSTITPVLNVNDFTCFLNAYATGCP